MKLRQWICGVLCLSMLTVSAFAADFSDTDGHWANASIDRWSGHKVISGYPDGSFRPDGQLTRGQMAVILCRLFGWTETAENTFRDLAGGEWYAESILRAKAAGVMTGDGDGGVRPNDPVTRAEAASMLCRALTLRPEGEGKQFKDQEQIAPWARQSVAVMSSLGLLSGTGTGSFEPNRPITRGETVSILDRAVSGYYDRAGVYTQSGSGAVAMIAAPGVTLQDMRIDGDLLILPGVGGSETVLSNISVTGRTRILSGQDAQILVKGESRLGPVEIVGAEGRLKLDKTARLEGITIEGSGVYVRGLAEETQVFVAKTARDVLVNGHPVQCGDTVLAGRDVSSNTDDVDVVVEPDGGSSIGGTAVPERPSRPGELEQPDKPEQPNRPEQPEKPEQPAGGNRDEDGNIIIDFDDLMHG